MTDPAGVHRISHLAMGTIFEILIVHEDAAYAGQAAAAAFAKIDRLESLFSRFDILSDIEQINRLKPGRRMRVGVETYECLNLAEQVREETGGAFDINQCAWENRLMSKIEAAEDAETELPAFVPLEADDGFEVLRPETELVSAPRINLDLGGIGKGFALDKALEILTDWGIENALLHGGTSTALGRGTPPDRTGDGPGWPVGIGGGWPAVGVPSPVVLAERALSGSGTEVKGGHINDPLHGGVATGHLAAWAAHPCAAISDAVSTAFMVMSTDAVEAFCAAHPDVWALVVIDYGRCRAFNFG